MKNRNLFAPSGGFFVSLALYILLFFWHAPLSLSELHSVLLLSFSAVPAFCLQLWLCRMEKVRFLPLCALALLALIGAAYLTGIVGSGWDSLLGLLLLCGSVAPAAGCALGWVACGGRLPRRLGAAGLVVLLAVYVGLKYVGGPRPFCLRLELMDLPVLVILAVGVWLMVRRERGVSRETVE